MTRRTKNTTHGGHRPGAGRKPAATGARTCSLSLRVTSDLRGRLEAYADRHALSLATTVDRLLDQALSR